MSTRHPLIPILLSGLFLMSSLLAHASPAGPEDRSWNFDVFLNDRPIGYHRFVLKPMDDGYTLETEAEFEVNVLFFTAYRYQHENVERWQNGCLASIDARTNDNGDALSVKGVRQDDGFSLARTEATEVIGTGCVRTFAYWDLNALKAARLLNSQTGEYQPVEFRPLGPDRIRVSGQVVDAMRYALTGEGLSLQLWYSPDGEWLKLSSTVENGRQLRYERVQS